MDVTHTRRRNAQRVPRVRRNARRKQQGTVILVVLMVVMMAGGLGMFAAQNATFESRSVGSSRQMQRMRRAGEGFLVAVETLLAERSRGGGLHLLEPGDARWKSLEMQAHRDAYGLPTYANDTSLFQVRGESLNAESYPLKEKTAFPSDEDLMAGVVTPFTFQGVVLLEMHELPTDSGQGIGQNNGMAAGAQAFRACATAYTSMQLRGQDKKRDGDFRAMHESVGVARAYFELR